MAEFDLIAPHDGADGRSRGQVDFVDAPVGHAAGLAIAMHDRLEGLGRAAAQAVHRHHVAAPHVGKQGADGRLRRRDGDVDLP